MEVGSVTIVPDTKNVLTVDVKKIENTNNAGKLLELLGVVRGFNL